MRYKSLDFEGKRVHVVQIGLGTNSTVVQNLEGAKHEWCSSIDWLMGSMSEQHPLHLSGIAVEPVAELVDSLWNSAQLLPHMELVQVAMGEFDVHGAEVRSFSTRAADALVGQVPWWKRAALSNELGYICNMSCVEKVHHMIPSLLVHLEQEYGVKLHVERHRTDIWSWGRLAHMSNFKGCELLLVDTEGYDCRILRSVIKHCKQFPDEWPQIIQFETMGHCDELEGLGTEWATIVALQVEGYTLLSYSNYNTVLVHAESAKREARLNGWLETFSCYRCWRWLAFPYVGNNHTVLCSRCSRKRKRCRRRRR